MLENDKKYENIINKVKEFDKLKRKEVKDQKLLVDFKAKQDLPQMS